MSNDPLVIISSNIELVSPYDIKDLVELRIEKKINDHVRLYFKGIIPEEKKDSYVEKATTKDLIEVNQIDDNSSSTNLFKGIVTNIEIKSVRGILYMEIEGASSTYDMDIKRISRSFQNKDMEYVELVKEVLKDYSGSNFIDTAAKSSKTKKFIIEYNETDWEFLIRMASHFNTGLVADCTSKQPKFWFGIPEGSSKGSMEEFNYSVSKKIGDFRFSSENSVKGIDINDFTYYEIETDLLLNIGDKIKFNNVNFIVSECIYNIKSGILSHCYKVSPKKGLSRDQILNKKVFRASVEGKVIEVEEDNLRIHLEIDKQQKKDEAFWFTYTTFYTAEGNTGWYCMPELDDNVKLYFPTEREEEAVVMNSIRRSKKDEDKINKPDEKYFRTKHKKEQMFSEKEFSISAKDKEVFILLNEDNGVEVHSDNKIIIKAHNDNDSESDIVIDADKIEIIASDGVNMKCNSSEIKMNGDTHISGSSVKMAK